jgi:hypothetical protein
MGAISHHGCNSKHNMTLLLQFQDWHTNAPPHGNPKHSFVPKIEDMDLGGSNLTQLARVDLQYEIRVHTKINISFETTNFHPNFRVDENEFEKSATWVLFVAHQVEPLSSCFLEKDTI